MTAAPILPQAPETQMFRHTELERAALELGVRFQSNAKDLKALSRDLYLNYQAWLARTPNLTGTIDGYHAWLEELDCGIPRTSLWRRLRVGFALKHGADPTWSDEDLIDAGQLLESGSTPAQVAEAVATQQVARRAEAARNKGVIREPLTDFGARVRAEIVSALRAGGVTTPDAELNTLAWQFCGEHAREFGAFVQREAAE